MTREEFTKIAAGYPHLRIAVVGDFCLDRYLEIDPARSETSIETELPVHNVTNVRYQAGGAGTILNNLAALGVGEIIPIGFCGDDAEGHELHMALNKLPGINLNHFLCTPERRTFTYCKPLICQPGKPPEELNRLDFKNWEPTPDFVTDVMIDSLQTVVSEVEAVIALDQVDAPDTGVIVPRLLKALGTVSRRHSDNLFIGDSRQGLANWPDICFKMNATEFAREAESNDNSLDQILSQLEATAATLTQPRFVTLSENGIAVATPQGELTHLSALPSGPRIDIVGAGDAVTANLAACIAAGGSVHDAARIANHAASIVIHKLGTTGTASVSEIGDSITKTSE